MGNSLLSHIATAFISQYENVANSSVAYLLNNYVIARKVLGQITAIDKIPFRYLVEMATGEHGRPDVTGVDETGAKVVIIEGKFWANLTDNQPQNYLKELAPGGRLLFLSPSQRHHSLAQELRRRVGDDFEYERLHIVSWAQFLESIERENSKEPNFFLSSDLAQLKALCAKMDSEGMPPLSASDLDPMNGRITHQLADLLDECRESLNKWEHADFKGLRATGWKLGYGFYFRGRGLGCQLFYSSHLWFTTQAATPIWLTVGDENFRRSDAIANSLIHWDKNNVQDDQSRTSYAIRLQPGMDRRAAIEHIVKSVKSAVDIAASK